MDYSPVCLFVYGRLEHTKRTLEALAKNDIADKTDLFIFCDNYKNERDKEKVDSVRNFIKVFSQECKAFNKIEVKFREYNFGLAKSIIDGVTKIINKYGKVIVLEDDLITSSNCIKYFNDCLNFYKKDEKIWSISGYSFPMQSLEKYDKDVFLAYRGCSWGWATWKNRWDMVDWDVKDYKSFVWSIRRRKKLALGGSDLPAMLDHQMNHFIDSWAIRWCYAASKFDMYTVYPKQSKIYNAGCDGSGTHGSKSSAFENSICDQVDYNLVNLSIEENINKDFVSKYNISLRRRIIHFIKSNILHIKTFRKK